MFACSTSHALSADRAEGRVGREGCVTAGMIPRQLQLRGKTLPPAIPLILPFSTDREGELPRLHVNEEALEVLGEVRKPVAVLSVCGPYRTGKSYLLSRLLGRPGTFQLGHSMDACTRGIWLSTTALECEDHLLLLLDTEGIGSVARGKESSEYLLKLLVVTVLLSSTLLYNSSDVPQASDLEQMNVFTHLTKCVAVRKGETVEESRPQELQIHFPNFIWLLRNVIYLPEDEEGRELDLETYIHSEVAFSTQQSRLVVETLESVFPSIHYLYLPPPSDDPTHIADLDSHWDQLEEDFREKMEETELYLRDHVTTKLSFDRATPITGAELAVLLREYIGAINTPGSLPNLEGSWVSLMKLRLGSVSSELVEEYTREMEERTAGVLPMEETVSQNDSNSLMQLHWSVLDKCYSQLRERITTLLPHHISDELSQYSETLLLNFASTVADFGTDNLLNTESPPRGLLLKYIKKNYTMSERACEWLWERVFEESGVRNMALRALNHSKAVDISSDMEELVEKYKQSAVGPAKEKVLKHRLATCDVCDMLRNLPGPPVNVRLAGGDKTIQKLRWDPPAINPGAANKYIVQRRTRTAWVDVKVTDKCWAVFPSQWTWRHSVYRVKSWSDEDLKGEMEEPLVVPKMSVSTKEQLSYV